MTKASEAKVRLTATLPELRTLREEIDEIDRVETDDADRRALARRTRVT